MRKLNKLGTNIIFSIKTITGSGLMLMLLLLLRDKNMNMAAMIYTVVLSSLYIGADLFKLWLQGGVR